MTLHMVWKMEPALPQGDSVLRKCISPYKKRQFLFYFKTVTLHSCVGHVGFIKVESGLDQSSVRTISLSVKLSGCLQTSCLLPGSLQLANESLCHSRYQISGLKLCFAQTSNIPCQNAKCLISFCFCHYKIETTL